VHPANRARGVTLTWLAFAAATRNPSRADVIGP